MRHDDPWYGIDVIGRLVEVAIAVTDKTLIHRTEALRGVGFLCADEFRQVIVVLDRAEERSVELRRGAVGYRGLQTDVHSIDIAVVLVHLLLDVVGSELIEVVLRGIHRTGERLCYREGREVPTIMVAGVGCIDDRPEGPVLVWLEGGVEVEEVGVLRLHLSPPWVNGSTE